MTSEAVHPQVLFSEPEREARWRARFSAARIVLPQWELDAPDRNVYLSNSSGVWEIYAWDRTTDTHRQVTNRPQGTSHAALSADGEYVWWFDDTDGDEFGTWVREPFAKGTTEPATPGTHSGYPAGLAIGHRVTALGMATDDGTTIWLTGANRNAEVVYASKHDAGVGALSRDERLLALSHSEHGDSRHPALRVLSTEDSAMVAEKWDGAGKGLDVLGFSPVAGDARLLVAHERRGRTELLLWDVIADTETELDLGLPGEVSAEWYPDGSALLVVHTHQARDTLHRFDIATKELSTVDTLAGSVGGACVRPDLAIEYSWSSGELPSVVRSLGNDGVDRVLLEPAGPKAPPSVRLSDVFVPGPGGQIHALVTKPENADTQPQPVVFSVHGGPHAADEDRFSAWRAVWVDAGFTVIEVNYRGSTGYGSAWRDAIEGRPGLTELADIAAVHDWAVDSGLADPERSVVEGGSWGGYLTLLALGTQPKRWAAGVAAVPVADYVAAYADEMEPLRDFDRALFGGSPEEVGEVYRECSPITYVDSVRAPVLILAGENDPRCPIRQVENYLARLDELGADHEVYRFDAGHGSLVVAETIKHAAVSVDFVRRRIGLV